MRVSKLSLSTGQTLSILTTAVVVAVLAVSVAVTWATLRRSALETAHDRMTRGVRQLAINSATGIRAARPRYSGVAADPAIRRALDPSARPADVAASRAALAKLQAPTDSGLPVELWRVEDHHRVAFVGDDAATEPSLNVGGEDGMAAALFRPGLDSISGRDSVQLGQIYSKGARTYYWLAAPVLDSGRAIGFIVKQGRIAANPTTERTVRELVGESVAGYYHNVDGTGWTTFGGAPTQPTIRSSTDSAVHSRPGVGTVIFAEQRVAGTPLVMAMEVSERVVLSAARRTVRALGALSVALAIAGAGLAWLIGGRVARPITLLTEASDAVAARRLRDARLGDRKSRGVSSRGDLQSHGGADRRIANRVGASRSGRARARRRHSATRVDGRQRRPGLLVQRTVVRVHGIREHRCAPRAVGRRPRSGCVCGRRKSLDRVRSRREAIRDGSTAPRRSRNEPVVSDARRAGVRWQWRRGTLVRNEHRRAGTREARDAALAASRAKSEFLTAMSHELRTPLNAIGGYAELMEMGIRGPVTQEQRRDLSRIRMSQEHLLGLIASLLDLTRIENGSVHYAIANVAIAPCSPMSRR